MSLVLVSLWVASASVDGGTPEPLAVRVLEREQLESAFLDAKALECDGKPVPVAQGQVKAERDQVVLGEHRCTELRTKGEGATLTRGERSFGYRGTLLLRALDFRLLIINRVAVEDYLRGVVGTAMPEGAPAALEAQAVVSRTFALAGRGRHRLAYDLCDLDHCQAYRGKKDERADASAAVEATAGEVLLAGSVVLRPAFFHRSCGGATASAEDVFDEQGLNTSVVDVFGKKQERLCATSPEATWKWEIDRAGLAQALGKKPEGAAFEPLRRDARGRVLEVRSFGLRLPAHEFRARVDDFFGPQHLRSMQVSAQQVEGVLTFEGRGDGHGVGLCQEGARALAQKGLTRRRILSHYFPGYGLRRLPP